MTTLTASRRVQADVIAITDRGEPVRGADRAAAHVRLDGPNLSDILRDLRDDERD